MNMTHKNKRAQGSALIMAVILIGVMSIGSAALWQYLHITLQEQTRHAQRDTVHHLAEAGLEKAIATLRIDPNCRGQQDTRLGPGTFSVIVDPTDTPGTYQILSTGDLIEKIVTRATHTLAADLALDPDGNISAYRWQVHKE
jgi:hypothetical protein